MSRGGRSGERPMVPVATFDSYYGRPVIKSPVWRSPDIPGYLFLGGLAGASSVLGAGASLTGRPALARVAKVGSALSTALGGVALVHDLGRPARFLNMLRVVKPTSPMNVGSWILSTYGAATAVAAGTDVTGLFPRVGRVSTMSAAVLGPLLASYTGALLADTAVPAWHDGYREMPFVFAASGSAAAGGLGLLAAPLDQAGPARRMAVIGGTCELAALVAMRRRMGLTAEPYRDGRAGSYTRAAEVLGLVGTAGAAIAGRRSRAGAAACGLALLTGSAATRWAVFHAGLQSASDPRYTVEPQRRRLAARRSAVA